MYFDKPFPMLSKDLWARLSRREGCLHRRSSKFTDPRETKLGYLEGKVLLQKTNKTLWVRMQRQPRKAFPLKLGGSGSPLWQSLRRRLEQTSASAKHLWRLKYHKIGTRNTAIKRSINHIAHVLTAIGCLHYWLSFSGTTVSSSTVQVNFTLYLYFSFQIG